MSFSRELKVAIDAAKAAGQLQMKYYKKEFHKEMKSDNTPVTVADKESEAKIISIIKKAFPSHSFLTEETGRLSGDEENVWIVDPVDGTKNFIAEFPLFGPAIALQRKGEIVVGVTYLPAMQDLVYAERGKGAYCNGKRIHVSKTDDFSKAFIITGDFRHFKGGLFERLRDVLSKCYYYRAYGDIAGYVLVAKGKADLNIDPHVKEWDIASSKVIIEEAGGRFTDLEGKETIHSGNCISSNGLLHGKILEILKGVEK